MKYKLGCNLDYEVADGAVFVFNVEVAHLARHRDLRDEIVLGPGIARETYTAPDLANRYLRVHAPRGPFSLHYEAEFDLDVLRADPATVEEVPVGEVPLALLPISSPRASCRRTASRPLPKPSSASVPKATRA